MCGSDPNPEEILKDRRIHVALHLRQPLAPEFLRRDPFPCAEFGVLRVHVNLRVLPEELAQEIRLILSVVPALLTAFEKVR